MYVNIRTNSKVIIFILVIIAAGVYYNSTTNQTEVIIYTSVDQIYSEPVLEKFEAETGIKVMALIDGNGIRVISVDNGLSHDEVKVYLEDDFGYLWLGTRDGITLLTRDDVRNIQ